MKVFFFNVTYSLRYLFLLIEKSLHSVKIEDLNELFFFFLTVKYLLLHRYQLKLVGEFILMVTMQNYSQYWKKEKHSSNTREAHQYAIRINVKEVHFRLKLNLKPNLSNRNETLLNWYSILSCVIESAISFPVLLNTISDTICF